MKPDKDEGRPQPFLRGRTREGVKIKPKEDHPWLNRAISPSAPPHNHNNSNHFSPVEECLHPVSALKLEGYRPESQIVMFHCEDCGVRITKQFTGEEELDRQRAEYKRKEAEDRLNRRGPIRGTV